jgi:hypothetical protein
MTPDDPTRLAFQLLAEPARSPGATVHPAVGAVGLEKDFLSTFRHPVRS